jgi:ribosomal protein S30
MKPRIQARTRKNATKIADECVAYESRILQTVEQ